MRENCTSGSVRGEGGNILTYSAGDFDNASRLIELLEARVGVGLQRALVELQVPLRVLALAVRGVGEPYRGRGLVARGPVVAHIGPEPSGLGLAVSWSEHRDRGVDNPTDEDLSVGTPVIGM